MRHAKVFYVCGLFFLFFVCFVRACVRAWVCVCEIVRVGVDVDVYSFWCLVLVRFHGSCFGSAGGCREDGLVSA